jgi:hypothetical protein
VLNRRRNRRTNDTSDRKSALKQLTTATFCTTFLAKAKNKLGRSQYLYRAAIKLKQNGANEGRKNVKSDFFKCPQSLVIGNFLGVVGLW